MQFQTPQSRRSESNPTLTEPPEGSIEVILSCSSGMIENREFDSHSLCHFYATALPSNVTFARTLNSRLNERSVRCPFFRRSGIRCR